MWGFGGGTSGHNVLYLHVVLRFGAFVECVYGDLGICDSGL